MQVNSVNSNQNFGMAVRLSPEVQVILAKRIKQDSSIQLLDSLVETQKSNPFKVDVRDELGVLTTYISDTTPNVANSQLKVLKQSFLEKHFKSPLAFIKRCCKIADKLNDETYAPNINKKLKNIFERTKDID